MSISDGGLNVSLIDRFRFAFDDLRQRFGASAPDQGLRQLSASPNAEAVANSHIQSAVSHLGAIAHAIEEHGSAKVLTPEVLEMLAAVNAAVSTISNETHKP